MKRPAAAAPVRGKRRSLLQEAPLPDKLPVSTLCGFLGAGKTTLLKYILESKRAEGAAFRCAVIVNDMAELNIDKALIDQSALVQSDDAIALQNGCVCCTLQNDLVTQIAELARKRRFHYMIIEASGVSEPSQIAKVFAECEEDHDHDKAHAKEAALHEVARLDTCVTMVDSADFFDKFGAIKQGPKQENFPRLLVEQVEYANVVVLNKTDLVTKAQLAKITDHLAVLNPRARVLHARNSRVDVREVVGTHRYKAGDFTGLLAEEPDGAADGDEAELWECCQEKLAAGGARCCSKGQQRTTRDSGKSQVVLAQSQRRSSWGLDDGADGPRHSSRFGITSFVYRARRPFHPGRFDQGFVGRFFVYHGDGDGEEEDDDDGPKAKKRGKKSGKKKPGASSRGGGGQKSRAAQQERERRAEAAVRRRQREARAKQRLRASELGGLLRSKGFLWLANRHELAGVMSHAGSVLSIEFAHRWQALEPKAWEGTEQERALARRDWVAPFGDRRQDLVFIGTDLRHEAIQDLLDGLLLTDAEMAMGVDGWKATMGDVLLESVMESDGDEDEDE